MECIAISLGNSHLRLAHALNGQVSDVSRIALDAAPEIENVLKALHLKASKDAPVVVASVNPDAFADVQTLVERVLQGRQLLRIEKDVSAAVGRQLDADAGTGEDRLLNAAGAYSVLKQACVIVDCGTAMTVDFVDGVGTFHGGAILPGGQLMLRAMHEHCVQLPEVMLAKPAEPIGHDTKQAMLVGTWHGLRGAVRELVEQYAVVAGTYPLVVVTGGDAEVLFAECDWVDRLVSELTLLGIAASWKAVSDDPEQDVIEAEA